MGENNTFGIAAGQAAINTASGLVGQTLGRIFGPNDRKNQLKQQAKLNQQAYDINNKMAEANYNREMRKWEETNYSAQKEQMIKAGLNPALLYGMSGGGGATATAAPGSGVSAGQAESARHGMGIEPVSLMQLEIMKAQKENIEADTANKRSENPNIGYTGENIQASTGNIKADTALKQVNTEIANLQKAYQNATLEQSIANFHNDAPRILAEAQSAMKQANVDRATEETAIRQIKQNLAQTQAQKALTEILTKYAGSNIDVNNAQITRLIQQTSIDYAHLYLQKQGLNQEAKKIALEKFEAEMKSLYPQIRDGIYHKEAEQALTELENALK